MKDFVSKDAAMAAVRKLHIGLDGDGEAALHVKRLLEKGDDGSVLPKARRFTNNDETRGMMLIGAPGSGKSHLMHRTLAKIPELAAREDGVPRYISVSVPSPATLKSVTLALLKKTGYNHGSRRQEVWALWQMLLHRLSALGIELVWIDEAQDLFCADRKQILRALKSLMQGDNAVAVIVSGTGDRGPGIWMLLFGAISRSSVASRRWFCLNWFNQCMVRCFRKSWRTIALV